MEFEGEQPRIVKKVKKGGGHHGGAWKVAYADFVTAMMALFIVLWVLSQSDAVKESVSKYFKDPAGFSDKTRIMMEGKTPLPISPEILEESLKREKEKRTLAQMGEQIMDELSEDKDFSNIMDQITIEVVDEGLRIELLDSSEDVFFEIGTATLKQKAILLLKKIGKQLNKIPNKIVVEGHTDARPYSGDGIGYSNFELSADRANSARRELKLSGLSEDKFDEIRGYADRRLKDTSDPYSLVNRRISIIVKYTGTK